MTDPDTDRIISDEQAFRLHMVEGLAEVKALHSACRPACDKNAEEIDKLKAQQNKTIGGILVAMALGVGSWIKHFFFGA